MPAVTINYTRPMGAIKPMHGINNAPFHWANFSLFHYLTEAGIPYSRLHDTGGIFGSGVYVDIANLFPNFDADPEDPASYDFPFNDRLLCELCNAGAKPFYRLGCTIENDCTTIGPRRIFPPKDAQKWAVICEHIIRHYNEGWADGHHLHIEYWEIWNEPDNEPDPMKNPMWRGSPEEYYHLYEVTANHLKACFPHLKIGGYASCGFYEILNKQAQKQANVSTRTEYFIEFFEGFLKYITSEEHKSPLDFFSWHSYSGPDENVRYAAYAREMLDQYGFEKTESFLNEWNPGTHRRGTVADAAHIGAMFIAMQHSPVDMLNYYDGQLETSYGGLWNPLTYQPFKAYHVFRAFNELYVLGTQYPIEGAGADGQIAPGLYALAAASINGDGRAVLLCNIGDTASVTVPDGNWRVLPIDNENNLDFIGTACGGDTLEISSETVMLLCSAGSMKNGQAVALASGC